MKIYIVRSAASKSILGAFSTKELAEAHIFGEWQYNTDTRTYDTNDGYKYEILTMPLQQEDMVTA